MKIKYVAKEVELSVEEKEILYKAEMIIKQMDDCIEYDTENTKIIKLALDRLCQLNLAYDVGSNSNIDTNKINETIYLGKVLELKEQFNKCISELVSIDYKDGYLEAIEHVLSTEKEK